MAGVTVTMEDCVNKIAEVVTPWRNIIAKEDSVSTSHHMIDKSVLLDRYYAHCENHYHLFHEYK